MIELAKISVVDDSFVYEADLRAFMEHGVPGMKDGEVTVGVVTSIWGGLISSMIERVVAEMSPLFSGEDVERAFRDGIIEIINRRDAVKFESEN